MQLDDARCGGTDKETVAEVLSRHAHSPEGIISGVVIFFFAAPECF